MNTQNPKPDDLLQGIAAIADALGVPHRRAKYLAEKGHIPTFRTYPGARTVCIRRSTLDTWLADREAAGREGKANG